MVISVASQKDGTGKTSTSIPLATGLARKDKRVLLIDIDSQRVQDEGRGLLALRLERRKGLAEGRDHTPGVTGP